jgi:hypothetical protein
VRRGEREERRVVEEERGLAEADRALLGELMAGEPPATYEEDARDRELGLLGHALLEAKRREEDDEAFELDVTPGGLEEAAAHLERVALRRVDERTDVVEGEDLVDELADERWLEALAAGRGNERKDERWHRPGRAERRPGGLVGHRARDLAAELRDRVLGEGGAAREGDRVVVGKGRHGSFLVLSRRSLEPGIAAVTRGLLPC